VSIGFGVFYFWEESENIFIAFLLIITLIGSYFLPPLLNFWRMNIVKYFFGVIILVFLSPTYINIIIIYSMANLHDISWGNRATDNKKGEDTRKSLEQFRALYLIVWISLNAMYGYSIIYISDQNQKFFVLTLTVRNLL
jgi:cellulose synthase/poly-beta-1,6-N-acetylglucosamine synthase-like glycosyltransferase